ncbi:MAG: hypothetical protein R6W48_00210 [Gaiellaceae bacterium]
MNATIAAVEVRVLGPLEVVADDAGVELPGRVRAQAPAVHVSQLRGRFHPASRSARRPRRTPRAEASEGRHEDAARMLGRARAELDEVGSPEDDFADDMVASTKERARTALGDGPFEAAYEAGRTAS